MDSKEGWDGSCIERPSFGGLGPGDYLLVLRGQAPEYAALARVPEESRPRLVPLVEVVPDLGGGDRPAADVLLERLRQAWPGPALCDASGLPALREEAFFEAARVRGAPVVPVAGLDRLVSARIKLARIGEEIGLGACFRLRCRAGDPAEAALATLAETLRRTGANPDRTDLVIDYGSIRDERPSVLREHLAVLLERLPEAGRWRSLAVAAGSFPRDLTGIPRYSVTTLRRVEWDLWTWLRRWDRLVRLPSYGDYGVQHPGAAAASARLPDNLRYAVGAEWRVVRGARAGSQGDPDFLAEVATALEPEEEGHAMVRELLKEGQSDPARWLTASMLRHLSVVLRQLEESVRPRN